MWYYKLTNSFIQSYIIPKPTVGQAKFSLKQLLVCCIAALNTEAATDHELCYYYHITVDELLSPHTVRLHDSCDIRAWFNR